MAQQVHLLATACEVWEGQAPSSAQGCDPENSEIQNHLVSQGQEAEPGQACVQTPLVNCSGTLASVSSIK